VRMALAEEHGCSQSYDAAADDDNIVHMCL